MKDLLKLASSGLPTPILGFVAVIGLLFTKAVSFEQGQELIGWAILIHLLLGKREPEESSRAKVKNSPTEIRPTIEGRGSEDLTSLKGKKPVAGIRSTRRNSVTRKTG